MNMLHSDIADSFAKIAHTIATSSVKKTKPTIALYILFERSSASSEVTRMSMLVLDSNCTIAKTAIAKQIESNITNEI